MATFDDVATSSGYGGNNEGHDTFWADHDRALLSGDLFFVCLETFMGLLAMVVAQRSGNALRFLAATAPSTLVNLAMGRQLVKRRERMARQRQSWLLAAWVARLVAYAGSAPTWDFELMTAGADPVATLLRVLLPGPGSIAIVALGQRLRLGLALPLQAAGMALLMNATTDRIVPVMERAAGPLTLRVCQHLEAAVQQVVGLALPGAIVPHPAPSQVCSVQAAARILVFADWALGFVLPMALVNALEVGARRQHGMQRLARSAPEGDDLAQTQRWIAYQRLSGQAGLLTSCLYVGAVAVVLALLWCLVTWLVV